MSSLAFDTHRAVKALCEAGAAEPLAEAFVETIGDAITGNVATKADIAETETALRSDIAEVRAEVDRIETTLKAEIAEVKADVNRVETTLKAEIDHVETTLKAEIGKTEAALRAEVAEVRTEVANVRAELKTDIGLVRAEIGDVEARLYRQLWLMAAGIVGLTVALVKLLG